MSAVKKFLSEYHSLKDPHCRLPGTTQAEQWKDSNLQHAFLSVRPTRSARIAAETSSVSEDFCFYIPVRVKWLTFQIRSDQYQPATKAGMVPRKEESAGQSADHRARRKDGLRVVGLR